MGGVLMYREKVIMYELIYAGKDVEEIIKKRYPKAVIKDASDCIHTERFELEIIGVEDEEFYPFAINEGFVRSCFSFVLLLEGLKFKELKNGPKHEETLQKIKRWIELSKDVKIVN